VFIRVDVIDDIGKDVIVAVLFHVVCAIYDPRYVHYASTSDGWLITIVLVIKLKLMGAIVNDGVTLDVGIIELTDVFMVIV
jgi:hypothetical protein